MKSSIFKALVRSTSGWPRRFELALGRVEGQTEEEDDWYCMRSSHAIFNLLARSWAPGVRRGAMTVYSRFPLDWARRVDCWDWRCLDLATRPSFVAGIVGMLESSAESGK